MATDNKSFEISQIPFWFRRTFEIIPGLIAWTFLFSFVAFSFFNPIVAAYALIAFDLIWLIKALTIAVRLVQGYVRLHQMDSVNWQSRIADLANLENALQSLDKAKSNRSFSLNVENNKYHKFIQQLIDDKRAILEPSSIYNAVIIATFNESIEILEPTIQSLTNDNYPHKTNMIVVIAYELRGGKITEETVKKLKDKYSDQFYALEIVPHKVGVKGEVVGKGPNITNAGRYLAELVGSKGIPTENVVVTTLDADNRPSVHYFNYLTFMYATSNNRIAQSFQPVAMFYNNIWDAPAAMRVVAAGNSFWHVSLSMRAHMIRNFSAHAQSLAALKATDFWSVETIVEDGHQFWRSYFRFGEQYEVIPLYTPIYQDAVLAATYWRTSVVQFKQIRRWAWGVSDVAYVAYFALKDRTINFRDKGAKFIRLFESHFTWGTAPLVLAFMGWAPLFLSPSSDQNIVAHQLPIVVSRIQTITISGLFITVIISLLSLPPRPDHYNKSRSVLMVLQWLLFPVTTILFGAVAALNAQTRLLIGKYLEEFEVTDKAIKKHVKS